jgi:WD40-like Beta Propeller Repeat
MFRHVPTRRFPGLAVWLGALLLVNLAPFVGGVMAQDPRIVKQLETSRARFKTARDWEDRRAALREGFLRGAQLWGFSPDGKAILFTSSRHVFTNRYTQLFTVPLTGGMPTQLPIPHAADACYSPDGFLSVVCGGL